MFKTTFKIKNKIDYLKNTPKFIKELVKQINNLCFFCKNFNFDDSNSLFVIAKKATRQGKAGKNRKSSYEIKLSPAYVEFNEKMYNLRASKRIPVDVLTE